MSKLEGAITHWLESFLVVVSKNPIVAASQGFKAGASWQAEQAKVLEDCLDKVITYEISRGTKLFCEEALKKYRELKGGG